MGHATLSRFAVLPCVLAVLSWQSAAAGEVTALYAMDADGRNVREVAAIPDFPIINSPEISPDGKRIAVDGWGDGDDLTDARILIFNLEDGGVVDLCQGAMPSWSADGKRIAFCKYSPQHGVYVRSVEGDDEQLIDPDGWGIQWSPGGLQAAYSRGGNLVIHDFTDGTKREIVLDRDEPYASIYWNLTWSPDSRRICFKGQRRNGDEEIGIVTVAGDDPMLRVRCDGEAFDPDIAWHLHDRIALVHRGGPGQSRQIYVLDPDGDDPPAPLPGQPADRGNGGMCWSGDGGTMYFLSRK